MVPPRRHLSLPLWQATAEAADAYNPGMPTDPATDDSPRGRRRAKARLDIARAALGLFQRQGYEATTVADIARAADFGERTFYRYFASKEDVVFFDIEHLLEEVREATRSVPPGEPLWPVLRANVVDSVRRFQHGAPEFATEVLRTWQTDPALAGPFQRFCGRWQEVFAARWSDAHGGGDPTTDLDAQLVAHYVVSTCQACFLVHVRTGEDLPELLERGFDRLDRGLGQPAATDQRETHRPAGISAS